MQINLDQIYFPCLMSLSLIVPKYILRWRAEFTQLIHVILWNIRNLPLKHLNFVMTISLCPSLSIRKSMTQNFCIPLVIAVLLCGGLKIYSGDYLFEAGPPAKWSVWKQQQQQHHHLTAGLGNVHVFVLWSMDSVVVARQPNHPPFHINTRSAHFVLVVRDEISR